MIEIHWSLQHPELVVGLVEARGLRAGPSDAALSAALDEAIALACEAPWPHEETRKAIRDMLRVGGFKPTGRNKPASEYLARAAAEATFPRINSLVDINNLVSLRTGWPISILDLDRARPNGVEALELRFGAAGESYVFNPAGHVIDLHGLLCIARHGGEPLGNAVKDSIQTKTHEGTKSALAVIYASTRVASHDRMKEVAEEFGSLLRKHAGAESFDVEALVEG